MKIRLLTAILFSALCSLSAQFTIDTSYTSEQLIKSFFNADNKEIQIDNITYLGEKYAVGAFMSQTEFTPFLRSGIVLSSGNVFNACGPNNYDGIGSDNALKGFNKLESLANGKSFDPAILEFDFIAFTDSVNFSYVFASEEYPEYVGKGVNDVFAFWIKDYKTGSERNTALLPNSKKPVNVDEINHLINSEHYYDNNNQINIPGKGRLNYREKEMQMLFQFDGFTGRLKTGMLIKPFRKYHFTIAISDIGDAVYDSWVMLEAKSFKSNGRFAKPDFKDLTKYIAKNIPELKPMQNSEDSTVMDVESIINFKLNSSEISQESLRVLDQLAWLLKRTTYTICINGYADDIGTQEYNLDLSQKRAEVIANYFAGKGLDPERLTAIGKGEIALKDGEKETFRAQNRKVVFVLN